MVKVYFHDNKRARAIKRYVLESKRARSNLMAVKWIDVKEDMPLKKLLEIVASGVDVVLMDDKSPVARVVSMPQKVNKPRVPGLSAGKIWISPDFDDPLPDEFWLGNGIL
jgi:antitoxin (DNA-binding transcriptional repressor) of toxin-antitoxin stability system